MGLHSSDGRALQRNTEATGSNQAIELYEELGKLWALAGMRASSNSSKLLERIPIEDRASEVHLDSDEVPMVKMPGVKWLPDEDVFTFKANPPEKGF